MTRYSEKATGGFEGHTLARHGLLYTPIGIVDALLWQTGVHVLFQVVADPLIGVHILLIAEDTWL